jgi:hypothetical protein
LSIAYNLKMTHLDIQNIKKIGTLKLTKGQLFGHYAIVPFLLIIPIMTTYYLIQFYVTKTYTGVRTADELMLTGYPWLIPALLLYFIQKRRLKFTVINISVNKEKFHKAAKLTADKLGWIIQHFSTDSVIAVRLGGFSSGSWGELITIIRDSDKVLINSICDPDNIVSVTSFGWNKKNVSAFKATLESLQAI